MTTYFVIALSSTSSSGHIVLTMYYHPHTDDDHCKIVETFLHFVCLGLPPRLNRLALPPEIPKSKGLLIVT